MARGVMTISWCSWGERNNSLQTYNVDRQVPDSAATATALFSGVKANYYTMGLDGTAQFNVCRTDVEAKAKVSSIIDWAIAAGKSTGKLRSEITACHHLLSAPSTFSPCPHDDFHSVYFTPDFLSLTLQHGCERTNAIFCHVMSYIHGRMEEEMDKLSALILCPIIWTLHVFRVRIIQKTNQQSWPWSGVIRR